MERLTFSSQIKASKERLWNVLWNDLSYRAWTSVFSEGSHAVSDWKEGSKIFFLGDKQSGMTSKIARMIPYEFMSFQHLGEVKDGVEDFSKSAVWADGRESYTLRENGATTELLVELDAPEAYKDYFQKIFVKALEKVKELAEVQKITPFLWLDHRIEEALNLYTTVFPNSKIGNVSRNGDTVFTASFTLGGQTFAALNGGPQFKLNPSISIFAICETEAEIDHAWEKLSEGGAVLMPLNKYPWSEKYGWLQDRFGLSWQLSLGKLENFGQKFTPALMFVGEQHGRAEEAINFYSSVFKHAHTLLLSRYEAGEPDPAVGTIKHAQFGLEGQKFIAMDSSAPHQFQFNEALSFVISCATQEEIDYFWNKLTDGGQESQCGWLKDRFGVSWQVVPPVLFQLLSDKNPAKSQAVMQAMLKMSKIEIDVLKQAHDQA